MTALQRRILKRLFDLRDGTTICPGRLSRDCGSELKSARTDLLKLAADGKIILSQAGKRVPPAGLKGPFRVRLK